MGGWIKVEIRLTLSLSLSWVELRLSLATDKSVDQLATVFIISLWPTIVIILSVIPSCLILTNLSFNIITGGQGYWKYWCWNQPGLHVRKLSANEYSQNDIFSDPDAACTRDCQVANQNCIIGCSGDVTCISNCNRSEAQCIGGKKSARRVLNDNQREETYYVCFRLSVFIHKFDFGFEYL